MLAISGVSCSANTPETSPENDQENVQEDIQDVSPDENKEIDPEDSSQIPEQALNGSARIVEMYGEIEDAETIVEDNKITFYLVTGSQEVSKERLKELSILFIKALSGYTVDYGLQGPSDESYGEIYDYNDAKIMVKNKKDEVIYTGTKAKGKNEIKWQE